MGRKRRKKGVLTSLRGVPKGPPKRAKKRETPFKKVLKWVGGGLLGVVILVMLFVFVNMMYNPQLGVTTAEAEVAVEEILDDVGGFLPEDRAVKAALVYLEYKAVRIPLRQEHLDEVEIGTTLHVNYTFFPRTGVVQVDEWSVQTEPAPGDPS